MGYIKPDSALVRAATDLLSRHAGQAGGPCPSCDQMSPCPSARHAIEVRRAAGLSDTITVSDPLAAGGGSDALNGGPLSGASSFGGGFGGTPSFGDSGASALGMAGAPALATAASGSSNVNSGAYGSSPAQNQPAAHVPVGLSKVTGDD